MFFGGDGEKIPRQWQKSRFISHANNAHSRINCDSVGFTGPAATLRPAAGQYRGKKPHAFADPNARGVCALR